MSSYKLMNTVPFPEYLALFINWDIKRMEKQGFLVSFVLPY